ncbi:hypothetical protein GCM10022419_058350 [Nonomuraea rosea]|uniref:Transmembrane protein n=1 Tax=Nonomuraea rosea TaxID=638574 RepID=A0ABP6XPN6_9ACTN
MESRHEKATPMTALSPTFLALLIFLLIAACACVYVGSNNPGRRSRAWKLLELMLRYQKRKR